MLGALLAWGSAQAHSAALFIGVDEFDVPAGMRLEVVGDALKINGLSTQIFGFRSDMDADGIAAHFAREWPGRVKRDRVGAWDVLSHRQRGYLVTVQTTEDRSGRTHGYLAASRMFDALERGVKLRKLDLPLLTRTQVLQDIEADDLGRRARSLLLLSEQSASQNLEFYRAHFRSQGFEPVSVGALRRNGNAGSMLLNRGGEQLNVAVSAQAGRTLVAIVQVQP